MRGFVSSGIRRKYSRREKTEALLAKSRFLIREAAKTKSLSSSQVEQYPNIVPHGPIYRNANAFYRSYLEMERVFKIYVYEEGEAPVFHDGPCRSIYSTEGRFIHEIEKGEHYRTYDPNEAHIFFMPFSVVMMVRYIYESGSPDMTPVANTVADYADTIAHRHPFWNRSLGADHFMLSCHDWGPYSSSYSPFLFNNSIRVLCNANTSEGFNPLKDLPADISYESMLKKSKFCLCPSGYEVASPRVVEAIYAECVPVLISDSYVPPFSDVLNWRMFSVTVRVKDIPKLKGILMGISEAKYLKMQRRVKEVQRHFVVNGPTKRFDLFHMIVHSVWLRRLNLRFHGL
ncbi:Probable glycosyltransferase [Striga hermonthica]|uniref:Probable glycosyltransferase n=1 Tax=Striga hermonthica TaxID=68872 RepID=A0A9N7NVJ9_STRHE|nr:Probable glycosyltransferase [Striga hermonthica]